MGLTLLYSQRALPRADECQRIAESQGQLPDHGQPLHVLASSAGQSLDGLQKCFQISSRRNARVNPGRCLGKMLLNQQTTLRRGEPRETPVSLTLGVAKTLPSQAS